MCPVGQVREGKFHQVQRTDRATNEWIGPCLLPGGSVPLQKLRRGNRKTPDLEGGSGEDRGNAPGGASPLLPRSLERAGGRSEGASRAPRTPHSLGERSLPTGVEDLTIEWRRQILQSEAESQRIAVRKLLNRLQHPGWYVSRLQTIRCGYTACGGYEHLGDATPAFPDVAEFPLHGLRKDGLKPSPKMASQCKPHAISLHCLDGILP